MNHPANAIMSITMIAMMKPPKAPRPPLGSSSAIASLAHARTRVGSEAARCLYPLALGAGSTVEMRGAGKDNRQFCCQSGCW